MLNIDFTCAQTKNLSKKRRFSVKIRQIQREFKDYATMQGIYEIKSIFCEVNKIICQSFFPFLFICCNFMPIEHLTLFEFFRTSSREKQLNRVYVFYFFKYLFSLYILPFKFWTILYHLRSECIVPKLY